jgi:multiple sugar transport system substrate-binding protein
MTTFQVILLIIFGAFLVIGVLIFAAGHVGNQASTPTIVLWGSIPGPVMRDLLDQIDSQQRGLLKISYLYKDPTTFDKDFTEAIATGNGPDLAMIPENEILSERNKLIPIPFATLSDREVQDTFIQETSLFRTSKGYLALAFLIDPLVMYWNRDSFQSAGIAKPPSYWDEFAPIISKLTQKDQASNILKSTLSFGEYVNVANAKPILSTLIMQAGNPITTIGNTEDPDAVTAVLDKKFNGIVLPAEAALDFYTQFADPANTAYSWNRSLPLSTNMFLSGDLATYFGFASELGDLQKKNPNLNFDVAPMPQPRNGTAKLTYGRLIGLALVNGSKNVNEAYRSMRVLTGTLALGILSADQRLPPTRRDLFASSTPSDPALSVFDNAALQSQGWLDPDPVATNKVFSDMIESIKSGSLKTNDAVGQANEEIQNLIK